MEGLISYSAIAAKLSAMRGKLLTGQQYEELLAAGSVPQAVAYLKNLPAYRTVFEDIREEELHRGRIEQLLWLSLYRDYASLYRFASVKQKNFLDIYFLHFEIDLLKRCLRNALSNRRSELNLSIYEEFFRRHSHLDLAALADCASLESFLKELTGSPYQAPLSRLFETGTAALFDYETTLDLFYFARMWKALEKQLEKNEREAVIEAVGEKLDLLNLDWLLRARQCYKLPPESIHTFLIPVFYRLKKSQLTELSLAAGPEEFWALLRKTRYKNKFPHDLFIGPEGLKLKPVFRTVTDAAYLSSGRKKPYSAAALNSFFYFKEEEIRKIITIIEGIRYRLDREELLSCLAES